MIGFIGVGNMGGCLVQSILEMGGHSMIVYDHHDRSEQFRGKGVVVAQDELEVVQRANQIFICIKPKDFPTLAQLVSEKLDATKMILSVMAGISMEDISRHFSNHPVKLVRIMPNTPSLVGRGAGGVCFSSLVDSSEREWVLSLLDSMGYYVEVSEAQMHAITALSGAGPAYMFMILEAMADAGVLLGLSRIQAVQLATHTMAGSAELMLRSESHPMVLKDQITSPGGVTIEALSYLEQEGLPHAIITGIRKAYEKSIKMGKSEQD